MAGDTGGNQNRRTFLGTGGVGAGLLLLFDGTRSAITHQTDEFFKWLRGADNAGDSGIVKIIDDPPNPGAGTGTGDGVMVAIVGSVESHVDDGTRGLYASNGQPVTAERREQLKTWSKETICFYVKNEEELVDGVQLDEIIPLAIGELEPESAEQLAESVVEATMEIRDAYLASDNRALFLSSAKLTICTLEVE